MSASGAIPVPTAAALDWRPATNPYLVAVIVTMATFMEVLDTSIANVALPHIAGNLSASMDEATWVLTMYLVANAIVLPLSAWFSALIGRKRFYMTCVALFTISSALCGMATNIEMLVIFRIIQGAAGGGLQPSEQAILVDTFPPEKRPMGMAVYGIAVVVAPILGPTLGGWITDNFSWHWIFFINVPVGVISMLLTSQFVEDPPFQKRRSLKDGLKIDYIGFGLIGLGLGLLQLVLDRGEREDWFESRTIAWFAIISVVALVGAFFWELRQKDPMVDLRLLKNRNFAISTMLMFVLGFALYGSTVILPIMLQTLMGYTATWSGLVLSPGGFATMLSMPLIGILLGRFQARNLLMIGLVILGISLLHMATFNLEISFWVAMWARVYQAMGLGFLFLPLNSTAYSFVPRDKNNSASGLINLARNLGGSFGIAFVSTMLARHSQLHQATLSSHTSTLNPAFFDAQQQAAGMLASLGAADPQNLANAMLYQLMLRQAAMNAYIDIFRILGIMVLAMIPLLFLLKKTKPGTAMVMH